MVCDTPSSSFAIENQYEVTPSEAEAVARASAAASARCMTQSMEKSTKGYGNLLERSETIRRKSFLALHARRGKSRDEFTSRSRKYLPFRKRKAQERSSHPERFL